MEIGRLQRDEIDALLALAAAEGWVSDRWEFDFLLEAFPQGCFAGRVAGEPVAFVTAVTYGGSGWVGNLIVRRELRGEGVGTALMRRALEALAAAGAETVWLTASPSGRPIYERMGFREVDVITRWRGIASGVSRVERAEPVGKELLACDRAGWGEGRQALLSVVARRGATFCGPGGFLIIQPSSDGVQVGPWGSSSTGVAAALLDQALAAVAAGTEVVLDVPVRNVAAAALLCARGFTAGGCTSLMVVGREPSYVPENVYALASLGSMG